MKLGYRDRIILLVVMVIVVFAIGIFAFIKPKWEELDTNKKTLETEQNTWNTQMTNFERINTLRDTINKRYNESLTLCEGFTDEMDSTELDQFLQEKFINIEQFIKNDMELSGSSTISDMGTATLAYYYYTPSIVTYPLYEAADFDGSLAKAAQQKCKESIILSARSSQIVGNGNATLTFKVTKQDTMDLIDAVRKYAVDNKDSMLLQSVSITDFDFNGDPLERDAQGNIIGTPPTPKEGEEELEPDEYGYTDVTFDFQVYYIQEPTKPDVGEAYDKSIWDGDAWRNYVSEKTAE
ncbi:MAG: hypothetical protein PUC41_00610 [Oscillospiraceae bacterium]|nr:hypothetical protein [Oscillospiraceae bacterium]